MFERVRGPILGGMRPLIGPIALLCALATPLAGCGGETKTTTETVRSPATAPATVATPAAATDPDPDPVTTPAATPPADEARKDSITVKGRRGDALTLLGQYATSVSGAPKARVKVKVALTAIRGPFSGYDVASGHKLMGFDVRITNVGRKQAYIPLPSGIVTLVDGERAKQTGLITGSGTSPCQNPTLRLTRGQSKKVCIAFDVPKDGKLQTFQFSTDSGYGDTGLWRLR